MELNGGEPMRAIDADAFAEFLKDAIKRQKYEDLKIDGLLTVADVIEAVISELDGTSLAGLKNAPTIEPEIIRCCDCRNWSDCDESCLINNTVWYDADEFCSKAERKTDGTD